MEANNREANAIEGFGSLAQPTRLAAVRHLLAVHPQSLPAGEIARLCEVPHNTMSTHLGILSRAGLISVEKDGRSMNYRADVDGFRGLARISLAGLLQRPSGTVWGRLRSASMPSKQPTEKFMTPAFNVLFLCTQNSARSIIAEALLEKIGHGRFRAYSAGRSRPESPFPRCIDRLKALGHDVSRLHSQVVGRVQGTATLPGWISSSRSATHPTVSSVRISAPSSSPAPGPCPTRRNSRGRATERTTLLNELYAMIRRRIEIFTSLPFDSLDRMAIKARLDEIGDTTRVSP